MGRNHLDDGALETMNAEGIKSLIYAEDFKPFRIVHKKGKTYDVPHHDYAWVSPIGVCVIVDDEHGRQHMEILNPAWIERVSTDPTAETDQS
jgi:hypothetical protein